MSGLEDARTFIQSLCDRIDGRLFGVREPVRLVLVGILTDAHVLIDEGR